MWLKLQPTNIHNEVLICSGSEVISQPQQEWFMNYLNIAQRAAAVQETSPQFEGFALFLSRMENNLNTLQLGLWYSRLKRVGERSETEENDAISEVDKSSVMLDYRRLVH